MNGMSLTAWKDEKVVRRFLRGQRQLKPTELLAVALILETTVQALMTPNLETWATRGVGFGRVLVGSLALHIIELATLLADQDHIQNPLGSKLPSGAVFEEEGQERVPSWRPHDHIEAWRDRVRGFFAQAFLPVPDDVDTATPEQLSRYTIEAAQRIADLISRVGEEDET